MITKILKYAQNIITVLGSALHPSDIFITARVNRMKDDPERKKLLFNMTFVGADSSVCLGMLLGVVYENLDNDPDLYQHWMRLTGMYVQKSRKLHDEFDRHIVSSSSITPN